MKRMNTMNKKYFWSACLCTALMAVPAGVMAQDCSLSWQDSTRLTVDMPLTAQGVKLSTNHRLIVRPYLCGADGQEMELPALEFSGKQSKKYFDRKAVLDKTERRAVYAPDDTVHYRETVTVEPWMRRSELTLVLRRELEDCCDITPMESQDLASTQYVAPRFDPVLPHISVAEQIAVREPVLTPMSEYKPFNPDIPLRRMKDALYVHFPVNKSDLREDFRENKETLHRILDMVKRIEADTLSAVKKIRIVGLASPEGPYEFNVNLSRNRAQVLKDYLVKQGVTLPKDTYELIGAGEAWADLRDVLLESNLDGKEELLKIIDETKDVNRREELLRRHNGGKSFRYLTQSVFADQRNSGYIQVYYDAVPDKGALTINRAAALIREGKSREAVSLLKPLNDSRKWNTLGAALYHSGEKAEALEAFRKAAENKNPGAEENLKALEKME